MNETKDIGNLKDIVRRRKKGFLLSFLFIFILGVILALVLPSIYLSRSTILIENQLIPSEYVQTTITGFVEERLQVITQQIMSRSRLTEIIKRFDLYQDMRARYTTEEILEKMREDISLETISADVIDRRTGRPTSATIAFSLSYEGKNPSTVQKVGNVLASLYLEMNLKSREQRASTTTDFFEQELVALRKQMDEVQGRITAFKQAHIGELPEYGGVNLQTIGRLESQLNQIQGQIGSLRERKILLEGQIANVDPLKSIMTDDGKAVMNPVERLKYLRLQLISLKSSLSIKHPDIKRLQKEIRELEADVGGEGDTSLDKIKRLDELTTRLAALKAKRGPKHPDVVKLGKEIDTLSREVNQLKTGEIRKSVVEEKPDNPAYISLETQIASTDLEIARLRKQEGQIRAQSADYRRKIEAAPLVEREYNRLLRDHESARIKYNELMNKLMEAKVAQGMEESQRGERFTIIDPAQLPERPYKPNRIAILLIALVLGLGAGVGMAALREALDDSVKTMDQLVDLTGVPVLSAISLMETDQERRSRRLKKLWWTLVILGLIALALFLVHQFVMPLEILWIKIQRHLIKMGISGFSG